jgi:hypothetical protein
MNQEILKLAGGHVHKLKGRARRGSSSSSPPREAPHVCMYGPQPKLNDQGRSKLAYSFGLNSAKPGGGTERTSSRYSPHCITVSIVNFNLNGFTVPDHSRPDVHCHLKPSLPRPRLQFVIWLISQRSIARRHVEYARNTQAELDVRSEVAAIGRIRYTEQVNGVPESVPRTMISSAPHQPSQELRGEPETQHHVRYR